jgi:putative SOS response-associated peptidase YedK
VGRRPGTRSQNSRHPHDFSAYVEQFLGQRHNRATGESAEWIRSSNIITGEPNELVAPIRNRMPVIISRETGAKGLGEESGDKDE